jgi:hypothetical protein
MRGSEDARQPGRLDLVLIGLGHHPGVRDDGDVGELVSGHECLDDRQHCLRLGHVALEGTDLERNPA